MSHPNEGGVETRLRARLEYVMTAPDLYLQSDMDEEMSIIMDLMRQWCGAYK